jgi:hypothetical protein
VKNEREFALGRSQCGLVEQVRIFDRVPGDHRDKRQRMAKLLARLWAGIVGAVAGACIGLVVTLLLLMAKFALDIALWAVALFAMAGAIIGFAFGNKRLGKKSGRLF